MPENEILVGGSQSSNGKHNVFSMQASGVIVIPRFSSSVSVKEVTREVKVVQGNIEKLVSRLEETLTEAVDINIRTEVQDVVAELTQAMKRKGIDVCVSAFVNDQCPHSYTAKWASVEIILPVAVKDVKRQVKILQALSGYKNAMDMVMGIVVLSVNGDGDDDYQDCGGRGVVGLVDMLKAVERFKVMYVGVAVVGGGDGEESIYASIVAATNPKFISSLVVLVLQQGGNCGERQTGGDELVAYHPAQQRASYEDLQVAILKRLSSLVWVVTFNTMAR
ncbi:hypothetical protein Tco_1152830 [Tanacetum coccineum]